MAPPPARDIVLDTTLHDLFSGEQTPEKELILLYAFTESTLQIKSSIPLSTKYAYQLLSGARNVDIASRIMLQLLPQHLGFVSGKMPLYLIDVDDKSPSKKRSGSASSHRIDASRVFESLASDQQPEFHLLADPKDLNSQPGQAQAVVLRPTECFLHLPHLVDPELHYELQSKRVLAVSDLPTPTTDVIDTILQPRQAHDEALVRAEVARMIGCIQKRSLPFVIKVQQSGAGRGSFLVRSEADRERASRTVEMELYRLLRQLNESNHHFKTSSLIVQEILPESTISISLFVPKTGSPTFLGACDQSIGPKSLGPCISYLDQGRLKQEYSTIIESVARYAQQKGYHGPFGVDVMTNHDGRHLAIDFNPRVTSDTPLCLLRNHFSSERSLHEATTLLPVFLPGTRDDFESAFEQEYREGSLIITGWSHSRQKSYSIAAMIIAAETRDKLQDFRARIEEYRNAEY